MSEDKYTPKQLAAWAKQFSETEFGAYYLELWRDAVNSELRKAMKSNLNAEAKAMVVEHASGIDEAIGWIEQYVELADNPERLRLLMGEEEEPASEE